MRDIRLYIHDCGILQKNRTTHKFNSLEECEEYVEKRAKKFQFVILEYFGKFNSKIIKVIN